MTPRHDEIVKTMPDGFTVAWDTTRPDDARVKAVKKVVKEQAKELGELFGADAVVTKEDQVTFVQVRKRGASQRSRARMSER